MKSKHRQNYDYNVTGDSYYASFQLNWDNINTFQDFKKAKLLEQSKQDMRLDLAIDGIHIKAVFQKWLDENPDFDKYFMIVS